MALVLRKTFLPRNASLLKCIKGRSLASAANKNTPAPLSKDGKKRSLRLTDHLKSICGLNKLAVKEAEAVSEELTPASPTRKGKAKASVKNCFSNTAMLPGNPRAINGPKAAQENTLNASTTRVNKLHVFVPRKAKSEPFKRTSEPMGAYDSDICKCPAETYTKTASMAIIKQDAKVLTKQASKTMTKQSGKTLTVPETEVVIKQKTETLSKQNTGKNNTEMLNKQKAELSNKQKLEILNQQKLEKLNKEKAEALNKQDMLLNAQKAQIKDKTDKQKTETLIKQKTEPPIIKQKTETRTTHKTPVLPKQVEEAAARQKTETHTDQGESEKTSQVIIETPGKQQNRALTSEEMEALIRQEQEQMASQDLPESHPPISQEMSPFEYRHSFEHHQANMPQYFQTYFASYPICQNLQQQETQEQQENQEQYEFQQQQQYWATQQQFEQAETEVTETTNQNYLLPRYNYEEEEDEQANPKQNPSKLEQHLICAICGCPRPCDCCLGLPNFNAPPQCVQCMTGYFIYPYGFWHCGPYNCPASLCGSCGPCACPAPACGPLSCCCCCYNDQSGTEEPEPEEDKTQSQYCMNSGASYCMNSGGPCAACCGCIPFSPDAQVNPNGPFGVCAATCTCLPMCPPYRCSKFFNTSPLLKPWYCRPCDATTAFNACSSPCGPFGCFGPYRYCGPCGLCGFCGISRLVGPCGVCRGGPCVPSWCGCGPCGPCRYCGRCGPCGPFGLGHLRGPLPCSCNGMCWPCSSGPSIGPYPRCGPCGYCGPYGPYGCGSCGQCFRACCSACGPLISCCAPTDLSTILFPEGCMAPVSTDPQNVLTDFSTAYITTPFEASVLVVTGTSDTEEDKETAKKTSEKVQQNPAPAGSTGGTSKKSELDFNTLRKFPAAEPNPTLHKRRAPLPLMNAILANHFCTALPSVYQAPETPCQDTT